jgi:hypothetical protein
MHNAKICSVKQSSVKSDVSESKAGGSGIFRGSDDLDRRTPLVHYLENLVHIIDTKVRRQALKYVLHDHDLYHRTIDGLLLRCLGSDQSKVDMGELMMQYALHISQLR